MLPKKIAFVDIETTGTSLSRDRIIEIGIVKVEGNKILQTYSTLINPERYIPAEITMLTGITGNDLVNAPTFQDIYQELLDLLQDYYFVAHNARFDLGFLKHEFRLLEKTFSPKHFCTVKLSRFLYPRFKHHNLDSLIKRHNLQCKNRHRALDDAKVIYEFYKKTLNEFSSEKHQEVFKKMFQRRALPPLLDSSSVRNLPQTPGVYIMYGENGTPLYVGKSKNIKNRVMSHFTNDHTRSLTMKMTQQVRSISHISTVGEIGALIKEAQLIRELQPLYNRAARYSRKVEILRKSTNKKGYYSVELQSADSSHLQTYENIISVFKSKKQAKNVLIEAASKFGLCEKLLGIDHSSSACFGYRLDKCKGACVGEEKNFRYNLRFQEAFGHSYIMKWPFGNNTILIQEKDLYSGAIEGFVVYKWCYLGSFNSEEDIEHATFSSPSRFDVTIYNILKRHIMSKNISVMPIDTSFLQNNFTK